MADQSSPLDSESVARVWFIATMIGVVLYVGTVFIFIL
jgi:hypothetical protein